jgi:hypothetical protein
MMSWQDHGEAGSHHDDASHGGSHDVNSDVPDRIRFDIETTLPCQVMRANQGAYFGG